MTDRELIEKRLALIETCVRELREIAEPARLSSDVREERGPVGEADALAEAEDPVTDDSTRLSKRPRRDVSR